MSESPRTLERALLVHVELPQERIHEDLEELQQLVQSAGAWPVACLTASRSAPDPRLFIGRGKAEQIRTRILELDAHVVIVNHELSPAQERNLEQLLGCRVVDRIGLILDIFAQRASSFEGKLQVELAQLSRLASRLVRGWTHLERQKGGIGLRGPGETQLETDRRLIGARIKQINRRLSQVANRRDLSRRARRKASVPVVSFVGYTNAGKSTLFNRMTGAHAQTANQLFATLDPTLRRLPLPGGQSIIVADTVGFIRHLPHELVAAFRATLEETRNASLLLHVIDSTSPGRIMRVEQVNKVLAEIGAAEIPQIKVHNKIDLDPRLQPGIERGPDGQVRRILMSAESGEGEGLLLQALAEHCAPQTVSRQLCLPPSAGKLRARLYALGVVHGERQKADGAWVLDVEIPRASLEQLCRSEGLDQSCIAA
nr:GTPase HflX [Gammaproteobacteria bacterium]